jgi:hypothetical protein
VGWTVEKRLEKGGKIKSGPHSLVVGMKERFNRRWVQKNII